MKKVVFFHHNTISVGAGLSALHILKNIPNEKYEVVVCLPNGKGDLKEKVEQMGQRVRCDFPKNYSYTHISGYHYNMLSVSHLHNVADIAGMTGIVRKIIIEEKPDVVMVNSMTLFWLGAIIKKMAPTTKLICFDRETYCRGLFGMRTGRMKRDLNRYFDKIVFLSKYDMQETGNENEKYTIITDKIDCTLYEKLDKSSCRTELELPQDEKLILFAGGISELKGTMTALQMINEMKTPAKLVILQYEKSQSKPSGIRLVRSRIREMLGKNYVLTCEKYIQEHDLWDKLVLRERTDVVEKYFIACDLIVFPSTEPHQARPVFEAGIAKRPIIISDFPNTAEFLTDENGWTADYREYRKWAGYADEILSGEGDTRERVEKNYEVVCERNDVNILRKELQEIL